MDSFPNLEPVHCSMSSSNCFGLTCIQVSQEAGKVVWYSHLFKNCPQSFVIHTIKGFSMVNETEVDVFLEFSIFFYDATDVGNLLSGFSAFSKSSLNIWNLAWGWIQPALTQWAASELLNSVPLGKWQPTPVLLPGKSHGRRSLVGYRRWCRKELDTTEQLHLVK